jgi:hypothetical protein
MSGSLTSDNLLDVSTVEVTEMPVKRCFVTGNQPEDPVNKK